MKKLIILSTQRSGSTMVCDDIAGAKVLGRPSEYFIKVIESIGRVSPNEMNLSIVEALKNGRTENGISAVKIMSNQIIPIGRALKDASICTKDNKEECFYDFFKDSVFARVIRNDKVAQAVSRIMAKQTDVYHAVDCGIGLEGMLGKVSKKRDESILRYDFEEIKSEIENINHEENFLDQFIERFSLAVEPICYEEAVENRSYVDKIALKLDINNAALADRRLKKISGSIAKEWISMYKDTLKVDKSSEQEVGVK